MTPVRLTVPSSRWWKTVLGTVLLIFSFHAAADSASSDDEGQSPFPNNEVLQATTMILFPIFPLMVTTDEIRYHCSENHQERAMLSAISDDAAAFLAGQEKSALLSLMMDRARKDLTKEDAQKVSDQDIAFRLVEKIQRLEAKP